MAANGSAGALSPDQMDALFNILTHYATYSDIETLKEPIAWARFGFPFADRTPGSVATLDSAMSQMVLSSASKSKTKQCEASVPVLQTLLVQFILPLPGVREFPQDWWRVRALSITSRLAQADLSEAYDKGSIGIRKTLATASGSVLEMITRAAFRGLPQAPTPPPVRSYDRTRASELKQAYDDMLQYMMYGNSVDQFFDHFARTDDLDSFMPGTPAVTDYIVIHLAGLIHQILVRYSDGPFLVKMLDNVQTMIPWKLVKQTLRVSNAGNMINSMLKIVLTKLSVSNLLKSDKDKVGDGSDEKGQNLVQKIISFALSMDTSDLRKAAEKIEKGKDRPSAAALQEIREHLALGREAHEGARAASIRKSQSIIFIVLNARDPNMAASLSASQHAQCLEYYAALLAIRDREVITSSLCREMPDHLTGAIREAVASFTPLIQIVHEGVDLKSHIDPLQDFIQELVKVSKPNKKTGQPPSIDDYVRLLHKYRPFLYRFLHEIASKVPVVWGWFREWAKSACAKFRMDGSINQDLQKLFASLDPSAQGAVLSAVNAHADYLTSLDRLSLSRLQAAATQTSSQDAGVPGAYLARWQSLIDETLVTPSVPSGPLRRGKDVKNSSVVGKSSSKSGPFTGIPDNQLPPAPDLSSVLQALGDGFGRILRERATVLQAQVNLS
ncbi:hypothetical protein HIM_08382 [Hirsutella minnesotensis 3608]|uniref:Uncharacterized protein n=1 Tax=Hirsutella minnesotensis 3608 TaxID=1043627 RepID=A0A0F7ZMM1_9HYPO|nr:hypothetical protein HIM_08382 [Hirsutella minnesotensis 3608]